MKRVLLVLFCVLAFPVVASHIVGGEFELIHLSGNLYRLNLIIYFDKINGTPGAKDDGVNSPRATIFRKKDGVQMQTVTLLLTEESAVAYTQPECSNDGLKTDRLYYTSLISLSPAVYNDPEGYYISWQRCCRNYQIDNIFSDNPQGSSNSPTSAGQTFYLEFPPVVKNGQPFINSSPRLFPPLSDYACPNRLYYVDFAGIDDDNDSLVYSLVTPLNTTVATALPPASPAPYPEVLWKPGFSLDRVMRGAPDLKISKEGLLTVTPTLLGLYVFAVKVEEYRNKVKIGESRRDFQMLVTDACPDSSPPKIVGKKLADADFTFDGTMSVSFPASTTDDNRKIRVRITDPDASKAEDNFTERVSIRVVPINFKTSTLKEDMLPTVTSAVLRNGSSAEFDIRFPQCPYFIGGPYEVGIIAMDDACSLPLLDTLRVAVNVEPPPNTKPQFITPNVTDVLQEGDTDAWNFEAIDADGDKLSYFILTNGFSMADAGMKATVTSTVTDLNQGEFKGSLSWDAFCDIYNFTNRTSFQIQILVDDDDLCKINPPDTATFNLAVNLPGNADPLVDTDLNAGYDAREINLEQKLNTDLAFNVIGQDLVDNDQLVLFLRGADFKPSDYNMTFPLQLGRGNLQSAFNWNLRCDKINLSQKDLFSLQFIVLDSANKCRLLKADTVHVRVKVLPADNAPPQLTVASLNERVPFTNNQLTAFLGESINLELTGLDADAFPDKDPLTIELIEAAGDQQPEGFSFAPATGTSGLTASFSWSPDCSIFQNEVFENKYRFAFRVRDQRCGLVEADTVTIDVTYKDYEGGVLFGDPPNVFTPNGDGFNDYYAMEKIDATTGELINLIPPDNCTGSFVLFQIINRWGKVVFESTDRNFRWIPKNEPAGVYYYYLKFTNREYRGNVSMQY